MASATDQPTMDYHERNRHLHFRLDAFLRFAARIARKTLLAALLSFSLSLSKANSRIRFSFKSSRFVRFKFLQ